MQNQERDIRKVPATDNRSVIERGIGIFTVRWSGALRALLVLFAVLMLAGTAQAKFAIDLEGENNPNTGWLSGGLSGWGELDFAPMRVDMTGGPATNQVITVSFPRFGTGTTPGIEDLYNWSVTTNVIVVSGPTLTVSTGNTWTYSITVTVTNAFEADIYFFARLAAGSHNFGGNSLSLQAALNGSPSGGQCQIAKPTVGNGQPDLGIIKTGPTLANAGSLVTYSLSYTNSTNNAAVGVQISDPIPTGYTFVSASSGGTTNGGIVIWDIGLVDKSGVGVVSVTFLASASLTTGTKITNTGTIATSDNDTNTANNTSSVVTTITNGCVPATIGAQPQSVSVCSGSSTALTVAANGSSPFGYQWIKDGATISGATQSAYTIASASSADVGSYTAVVTNACGSVTSSVAVLTLNTATTAAGVTDTNACPGSSITLATVASGTGPFTYQWQKNGANLTTQTNSTITLTNLSSADTATYGVVVTGTCNSVTNKGLLTVNTLASSAGLTSITNNCSGTTAGFTEVVLGTGPFAYVWKKNGTVIPGQTTSSLIIPSTAVSDSGTYTVEVTGLCNSISNSATLIVSQGTFGSALTNVITCPGSAAGFSTTASGAGPFSYQWRKNGSNIPGETTSSYAIASVSAGDAGTYSVAIAGNCNTITNSATLTVNTPVSGGTFGNQTVCQNQSATFITTPAGSGPFVYVWKKDGVVQGSTSNSLTIASAATSDAGTYTVEITGPCTSVTNSATLTVNSLTGSSALTSLVRCPGDSATFSTVTSGTGPFVYVWKKNGVVQSSTTSSLSIASVASGDAGTYTVEVGGTCNSVTNTATLTVNTPTTASALSDVTNCVGQSVTFTTTASGTGTFGYVWKKDGVVQGSTSNSLTIDSISSNDAGTYTVEVTGTCNSVTNNATLTVNTPTTASNLTSLVVCPGQPASFTTVAAGTGPFSYIWKKDGVVQSSTSNSLTVASAADTDAGIYTVEVYGTCNAVTNSATLTVNTATTASALISSTNCLGSSVTFSTIAAGTGPITYVWRKDGVVQSSTSNSLTIDAVAATDAGTYAVEVYGLCNNVTNSATLTVNTPTTASSLGSLILCPNQGATFNTVASGTGPFTYVWKKDGVVQSSTTDTLTITSVASSDAGTYTVEVTGACNSVTNSATLTVNDPTTATPLTDIVTCGQSATFTTIVSGTGPFTFVWKKDGVVQSSTTNSLTVPSVASGDAGTYTVEVYGLCNNVTNSATLTLNADTTATPLSDVVTCESQSATFSTTASGSGPFTYVWKKDGVVQSSTTNSLTIASVTSSDAGTYTVEINGACNSVTNSATLTVNTPTTSSALDSLVVCPGNSATFVTTPSGTGPFTYIWKKDGVVQGSTSNSLTVVSAAASDAGVYSVEVGGACNVVTNSATLTVNTNTSATSLTDLVLCPGQDATFTTTASGTGPFVYVWKKDGAVINGATTNTITVTGVAAADAGVYSVEVSGTCNVVTNTATLTVNENVAATALSDVTVCENQPASFATTATGTGPITYVWKKDGTVLPSATDSSFSIASAQVSDAGVYTVEVSGLCTSVTNSATLTVNRLTDASDLTSLVLCPGASATFTTVPSGTGPFTFVWSKDGQPLATETNDHLTLTNISAADQAVYSVHVAGTCNGVDKSATLTVNTNTAATSLTDLVLCPDQIATFTTVASGTGPFVYVWKKDGAVINGATTNTITVSGVAAADAGIYSVEVSGTCNIVTNTATLTVNENVAATGLSDVTVCENQPASFATTATGTGPINYVWKKDGTVLPSATDSSFSIASAQVSDAGVYTVEVSGLCTSVTNSATLTVNRLTDSSDLTSLVLCPGASATFTTVPSGTGPFTFVWSKDGQPLATETSDHLTLTNISAADQAVYTVHVAGTCNGVDKSATLTVNTNTAATSLTDLVLCPGQDATFTTTASGTGPFVYVWKKDGAVINGATTNTITVSGVAAADAGVYSVEVSGTCNVVTNTATLTVNENVAATALSDVTVCENQPAGFATTATGTGPITYVWKKDGSILPSATDSSFSIASAQVSDAGVYTVEVSGLCTSVTNSATLTVNRLTDTSDLTSLVLCPGASATFTTVPSGTGPFTFVWSKDGQPLATETNDHLTLTNISAADQAVYSVHVAGTCNGVDKSATLTVNTNTSATSLADLVLCPDQIATFTTVASGTGPFSYVWKKDGVVLDGQTTNSIAIGPISAADAGTYTVEVTGVCTSVTNSATLGVNENVSSTALTNLVVCQGQPATFVAFPSGTGPFTFVWKKDGSVLNGETQNSLTIQSVDVTNAGLYTVEVGGTCSSVTNSATLTVNLTTATSDLTSLVLCPGQNATFTTVPSGTGPFTFVWSKDGQTLPTETNDHITLTNISAADQGLYSVHVSGNCNAVDKSATLTVNTNTSATSLTDLVLCPTQIATFTTVASGTGPFSYVWKKDGVVMDGQTTNTISVGPVSAADAGSYTVEVNGLCNNVTNTATLTVNENVAATPLTDVIVCENQPASFATSATGTGPITYVWRKDGNILNGATDSSFAIASAQVSDAGLYTVEVTGLCTSVTNSANLTVNRLTDTSDLTSLVLCPGATATFTTVPSGTGPFTFIWSKGRQPIGGETNNVLTLTNITARDAGDYTVHVIGTCNTIDKTATLTVNTNTSATSLTDLVLCPTQPATFTTVVSGTGPFAYVWKKDGVIQSSTSNTLAIASVSSSDAGLYTVEVTGACTAVTNSATLTVNTNTAATSLTDLVLCPGQPAAFTTVASGTGPFAYVWKKDGVTITNETTNTISIAAVTAADAGLYTVEVTGVCTSVTNTATLTVNENVSATSLVDSVVCQGQPATFSTTPSGTGPYVYVWRKDGNVLDSQTQNSITIPAADVADAGVYTVEVSGLCTSVTNSATLTVNLTTGASDLTSLVLCPGQSATFTTVPSGTGPFTYAWSKDGQPLPTETADHITITNVSAANAGSYNVHVTGTCNSVDKAATLTVNTNTAATDLQSLVVCPGQAATFTTIASGTGPFAYVWKKDGVIQSSTSNTLAIASTTNSDSGTYTVEVNGFCTSVTNSATLTVNSNATSTALIDLVRCPGDSAVFSTVASGTGPFSYIWRKDGNQLQGETNSSLTISPVTAASAGVYSVEVGDTCTSATNSASLVVNTNVSATALSDVLACPGSSATFTTTPSGTGPYTFIWRKNGSALKAGNTNFYTIPSAQLSDAGTYSVEVYGACTAVTNSAVLTLNTLAASPLVNQTGCPTFPVTFATTITATGPYTIIWQKNGSTIGSATSSSYTIASAQSTDAGTYSVIVSSACTSVTNSATLVMNQSVTATALVPITRCPGQSATFSTVAGGSGPFTYVWKQNGQTLANQTSSSLTINAVTNSDAGTYSVVVSGVCSSVTNSATLNVKTNASGSALANLVACTGQNVTFTTVPSGNAPFAFKWRKNGGLLSGATTSSLTLTAVTTNNSGTYSVEITGSCNTATNFGTLTVNPPVSMAGLADETVCFGETANFGVTPYGGAPFVFVWRFNGSVVAGQTTNTLSLTNLPVTANGPDVITCELYASCGSITNTANLNVFDYTPTNGVVTLGNPAFIKINDNQPATPFPSIINVRCLPSNPKKVTVTLNGLNHQYASDVDILLVNPMGKAVQIMAHCGGGYPVSGSFTFDDDATNSLPYSDPAGGGYYKPTSYWDDPVFLPPAPTPNASRLSELNMAEPTGLWQLYVEDDSVTDDGNIFGGWSLTFFYADFAQAKFINSHYLSDGTFQTTLIGTDGLTYQIQSSTDFVTWTPVINTTVPGGSYTLTLPVNVTGPQMFFRAVEIP